MSSLEEIVAGASGDEPVPTLLRKLRVVAVRTGAYPLDKWASYELEGYPSAETVPTYRGPFAASVRGQFLGAFGRSLENVAIPPSTLPEPTRDALFTVRMAGPIAAIQSWDTATDIPFPWPADTVRYYNVGLKQGLFQRVVTDDFYLAAGGRYLAGGVVVGLLDSVRTRILDLALNLGQAAPDAGERIDDKVARTWRTWSTTTAFTLRRT
jgi:hypothetical protein